MLLEELAKLCACTYKGDPQLVITAVASLEEAGSQDLSFCANTRYFKAALLSKAGAICISPALEKDFPERNLLVSASPSATFQKALSFLLPPLPTPGFPSPHPTASIHPKAKVHTTAYIGPYVCIEEGCVIEAHVVLEGSIHLCPNVVVKEGSHLYPGVVVRENCIIGKRCILQPGAIIGACGFGYEPGEKGELKKQEQLGNVVLEDYVEIGANTTIDRARFKETRIQTHTKIDNLVQIGHNCQIGPYNIIVALSGISGSVKTEEQVVMAGQTGVVGHLSIAKNSRFAARSGIRKSIKQSGDYGGDPAINISQFLRQNIAIGHIEKLTKQVHVLEQKIQELEEKIAKQKGS